MKILKKIILIIILVVLIFADYVIFHNFKKKIVRTGIVDSKGTYVVDSKYESINASSLFNGYKNIRAFKCNIFGANTEIVYVDTKGNEFLYVSLKDGSEEVRPNYFEDIARIADGDNNKFGYIDADGNKITEFIYDAGSNFQDGYAKVGKIKDGKTLYGIIDSGGIEILPCEYDAVNLENAAQGVLYGDIGDEDYIFDSDGNKIAEYDEEGLVSFIDLNDLTELGKISSNDISLSKNVIFIEKDDKVTFYDRNGYLKEEFTSDKAKNISTGDLFLVEQDGKRKIVDPVNGYSFDLTPIEEKGYEVVFMENERLGVTKDNKLGVLDLTGKVILDTVYDSISNETANKGFFSVTQDGKNGVFDIDGNTIIECKKTNTSPIMGDGEFFVIERVNTKLLVMWIVYIAIVTILEVIVVINIFKRKK